jgi:hypothetical protein
MQFTERTQLALAGSVGKMLGDGLVSVTMSSPIQWNKTIPEAVLIAAGLFLLWPLIARFGGRRAQH